AAPAVCRFHETGITEGLLDGVHETIPPGRELAAPDDPVIDDGQTGLTEDDLHHSLVHPHRRSQDAGSDVRDVGEIQETLQRAVLASRAVHDRENDVETTGGSRPARTPSSRRRLQSRSGKAGETGLA